MRGRTSYGVPLTFLDLPPEATVSPHHGELDLPLGVTAREQVRAIVRQELNALKGGTVGIYRRRPTEVKAFQWWPGKEIPGVAYEEDYTTEDLDGERRVRQRPYVVTAHGQRAYLAPGDWVLPEPNGRGFYPCKPEIFEANWELIEG
jgi:hypothetical protein